MTSKNKQDSFLQGLIEIQNVKIHRPRKIENSRINSFYFQYFVYVGEFKNNCMFRCIFFIIFYIYKMKRIKRIKNLTVHSKIVPKIKEVYMLLVTCYREKLKFLWKIKFNVFLLNLVTILGKK